MAAMTLLCAVAAGISGAIFIDAVAIDRPSDVSLAIVAATADGASSTLGHFCQASSECNEQLYEYCAPFNACMCDGTRQAFYDESLQRCNPCPNALQTCAQCCDGEVYVCINGECLERQWWL